MPRMSELFEFKALVESDMAVTLVCYSAPYQKVACFKSPKEMLEHLLEQKLVYQPEIFEIQIGTTGAVRKNRFTKKRLRNLLDFVDLPESAKQKLKEILL